MPVALMISAEEMHCRNAQIGSQHSADQHVLSVAGVDQEIRCPVGHHVDGRLQENTRRLESRTSRVPVDQTFDLPEDLESIAANEIHASTVSWRQVCSRDHEP